MGKSLFHSQVDYELVNLCSGMKLIAVLSYWEETNCSILLAQSGQDVLPSEASEMGLRSDMNLKLKLGLCEDTQFAGNALFSNQRKWNLEQI